MEEMKAQAKEVAALLKILANENRLLILCSLLERPMSVGELVDTLDITQSGISQHLTLMKTSGLLDYEKKGQTITYTIKDTRVLQVMQVLKDTYCH